MLTDFRGVILARREQEDDVNGVSVFEQDLHPVHAALISEDALQSDETWRWVGQGVHRS